MKRVLFFITLLNMSVAWSQESTTKITAPSDTTTTTSSVDSSASTSSASAADTSEETSKIKKVIGDKKFEEDKKINDLELRAYSGSLNRYSLQISGSYGGPAINDLSNPERPNPNNSPGDQRSFLSGSASARYRFTKRTGMNFGTGYSWYTPIQAVTGKDVERRPGAKTYDFHDPRVSADTSYTAGATQFRSSVYVSAVTTTSYVQAGEWAAWGFNQYAKWNPGHSRWVLGTQVGFDQFLYDREYLLPDKKGYDSQHKRGDGNTSNYFLSLIPSVEYKLTDSLNFNTSLGYSLQSFRKVSNWSTLYHPLSTWRVGVGWAITHTIYVNPYINFFAEKPSISTTTASLNTTFSVF